MLIIIYMNSKFDYESDLNEETIDLNELFRSILNHLKLIIIWLNRYIGDMLIYSTLMMSI